MKNELFSLSDVVRTVISLFYDNLSPTSDPMMMSSPHNASLLPNQEG